MEMDFWLCEVEVCDDDGVMPPCPEEDIPDWELERLNQEIFDLVDAGAFDPANEILEP